MSFWEQIKQDSATFWSSDASLSAAPSTSPSTPPPSATPRSTASQPSDDRSVPGPALSWPRTQPPGGVKGVGGTLGPSRVPGTQVKIPPVCARARACVCAWQCGCWGAGMYQCVSTYMLLPGVWRGVVQGPGCGVQTTKKYKVGKTCVTHESQKASTTAQV